jgi:hypothetical protein
VDTCRTRGQLAFRYVGEPLELVVAGLAEVGGAEAEEDGDGAAVAALVLEEVGPVLGAHSGPRYVATTPADELHGVEGLAALLDVASRLPPVIRLLTLVAHVISVSVHGIGGRILVVAATGSRNRLGSVIRTQMSKS